MTRGSIRPTTPAQAVQNAFAMITAVPRPPEGAPADGGHRPISYRLEEANGDRDPFAPHCADWSYGLRTPTADCIGFVLWCSGIDRYQPNYHGSRDGWLNCVSLLDDADGARVWCEPVAYAAAQPGDWLVTSDHIGLIVRSACYLPDGTMTSDHLVVDCSPRHGRATAVNTGYPWSAKCRVVRYRGYEPASTTNAMPDLLYPLAEL
jgi:hypothetical protein